MADIRSLPQTTLEAVTVDWLLQPNGTLDNSDELRTAVVIALLTYRRADPDDVLPSFGDDRKGWWADHDAAEIWDGWPIGSRLWLLRRAKIADVITPKAAPGSVATPGLCEEYIAEALQPFVDRRIISSFVVQLARTGVDEISGVIYLFRGPTPAVELRFEDLWREIRGAQ